MAGPGKHRRRNLAKGLAIAGSAVFHAIVFAAMVWNVGTQPAYPVAPVMLIELTPRPPRPRPSPREPRAPPPRVLARPAEIPPPDAAAPSIVQPRRPGEAGVRNALRGRVGCDRAALLAMTSSEREACLDRLAKARETDPKMARLDLDPRGRFATEAEPYLARKPKNGCKVGAGGDVAPFGEQGAAVGLNCAWSF